MHKWDLALWDEHYDLDILAFNGTSICSKRDYSRRLLISGHRLRRIQRRYASALAKLMLNNFSGKFATNPDVTGKIPVLINDTVKLVKGPDETRNSGLVRLWACLITACQKHNAEEAQAHYDRFLQC